MIPSATVTAAPAARSGARKPPTDGWWGLRPRIGRGRGERVLLPDERRGRGGPGKRDGLGPLVLRTALAAILIILSYDKVLDADRLAAYSEQLATGTIPPMTIAMMLAYLQLIAGVGLAIGLMTRPMALLAVIYAVAALIVVRSGGLLHVWILPLATLAGALVLMLRGPGRFSLDGLRGRA